MGGCGAAVRAGAKAPSLRPSTMQAWVRGGGRTPFPSQIPVAWHGARLPELPENDFRHVVRYTAGNRFELSLSAAQVMALVSIYMARPHNVDLESDGEAEPIGEAGQIRKPRPADFVKHESGEAAKHQRGDTGSHVRSGAARRTGRGGR